MSRFLESWKTIRNRWRSLILLPLGVIFFDQLTKTIVRSTIPLAESWIPFPSIGRAIRVLNLDNSAAAFGLLGDDSGMFITIFAFVAIGLILAFYPRLAVSETYMRVAFGLLLGGFAGNLIDRLIQGYVTDILVVLIPNAFNLADLANLSGFLVLLIGYLEESSEETEKKPEKS
jgi:signal peptidase II